MQLSSIKKLFISLILFYTANAAFGMSGLCGLIYVSLEGKETWSHYVEWDYYDNWTPQGLNGDWITVYSEVQAPDGWFIRQDSTPMGGGGYMLHYLPDPVDGYYDGLGYSTLMWSGGGTFCQYAGVLDTVPPPTVSLVLNPSTAVVGESVSATWTVSGAVSCTGYGPALPGGSANISPNGNTAVLTTSASTSDAGSYWVMCAASDQDQTTANAQLSVATPSVILNSPSNLDLNDDYSISAVVTPSSASVDNFKYEIRFDGGGEPWYELYSGSAPIFETYAHVTGEFEVRAKLEINDSTYYSNIKNMSVIFPTGAKIYADNNYLQAASNAWSNTLSGATSSEVREYGFWVVLNTATRSYSSAGIISGGIWSTDINAWPVNQSGQKISPYIDLGEQPPPDSISNPTPIDYPTYTVASFHTHPPATYIYDSTDSSISICINAASPSSSDSGSAVAQNIPGLLVGYNQSQHCTGDSQSLGITTIGYGPSIRGY